MMAVDVDGRSGQNLASEQNHVYTGVTTCIHAPHGSG